MNARTRTARRATVVVALAAALPIGLAACGSTTHAGGEWRSRRRPRHQQLGPDHGVQQLDDATR